MSEKRKRGAFARKCIIMVLIGAAALMSLADAATAAPAIEITKAEWMAGRSTLVVLGESTSTGEVVTVRDADSGKVLGTTRVNRRGSWRTGISKPDPVPCRVEAEAGGATAVRDVASAPNGCGGPPPAPSLMGLSISGPASLNEGTSAGYAATATYSDGSTQVVTAGSAWNTDNPTYASIDHQGVLTAYDVSGNRKVTVTATYPPDTTGKTATVTVTVMDLSGHPPVTGSHAGRFTTYEGTKTCLTCHREEALQVHGSVHYQWKGDPSEAIGLGPENAGKYGGINDFCIFPDINWIGKLTNVDGVQVDGGCAKCHAGMGDKPTPDPIQSQLENIDCLICHSAEYKRKVESVDGGTFRFVPDEQSMTVGVLQAASDITLPSKDTCLDCHTKSGGGDNYKRGDIEEAHRDPARAFDVHMASKEKGGAGLECLDCHTSVMHRISGRGTDLRPLDTPDKPSCTKCHDATPHGNYDLDKHTDRVNCTVCHIPFYARGAPTDMERDWGKPAELDEAKRLYDPHMVKESNVVPEYGFFNGLSHFYRFGDPAVQGANGRIMMSAPDGDIRDSGVKLHAFKHHLGNQPIDPVTRRLLPLKIGIFFQNADLSKAVEEGARAVGWQYNGFELAETERYMGLFHEVAPAENALSCNSCHNGGTRIDFDALGYTPNPTYNGKPLCASCHEDESDEWSGSEYFTKVHNKHVKDKRIDCIKCHSFSGGK